jgi:2'-5' RNA ligase
MIRLFVALDLPVAARTRLTGLCYGIEGARWVVPENLHLTLRYIGEIDEPAAADVVHALEQVQSPGFELQLDGVGHFESGRKIRSLWAGIAPQPALIALQERIDGALFRAGFAADGRKFSPHITLARLGRAPASKVHSWLEGNGAFCHPPIEVAEFVLFASHLGQGGAIYEPLESFRLI